MALAISKLLSGGRMRTRHNDAGLAPMCRLHDFYAYFPPVRRAHVPLLVVGVDTTDRESLHFGTRIRPGAGSTPPPRGSVALYAASMSRVSESGYQNRAIHYLLE